jgi:hypothetical protein
VTQPVLSQRERHSGSPACGCADCTHNRLRRVSIRADAVGQTTSSSCVRGGLHARRSIRSRSLLVGESCARRSTRALAHARTLRISRSVLAFGAGARAHPQAAAGRRVSTRYAIVRVLDFSRPSVHAPQSDEAASCTRGCAVPCPHIWRWSQRHRTVSSDNRNAALHKPFSDSTDTSLDCGRAAGEDRRRYRRIQTRASMCTKWTNRH